MENKSAHATARGWRLSRRMASTFAKIWTSTFRPLIEPTLSGLSREISRRSCDQRCFKSYRLTALNPTSASLIEFTWISSSWQAVTLRGLSKRPRMLDAIIAIRYFPLSIPTTDGRCFTSISCLHLSATASLRPISSNMNRGCTEEKPKANKTLHPTAGNAPV